MWPLARRRRAVLLGRLPRVSRRQAPGSVCVVGMFGDGNGDDSTGAKPVLSRPRTLARDISGASQTWRHPPKKEGGMSLTREQFLEAVEQHHRRLVTFAMSQLRMRGLRDVRGPWRDTNGDLRT